MLYVDTSVIVKLYVIEEHSQIASKKIIENNEAIPLTKFHDLEFNNALNLKKFRNEISSIELKKVLENFENHESIGVFYRPIVDWSAVFQTAVELSASHSERLGSRSLDIIHVASALYIKAERFFTFDEKQLKLASNAGLRVLS